MGCFNLRGEPATRVWRGLDEIELEPALFVLLMVDALPMGPAMVARRGLPVDAIASGHYNAGAGAMHSDIVGAERQVVWL